MEHHDDDKYPEENIRAAVAIQSEGIHLRKGLTATGRRKRRRDVYPLAVGNGDPPARLRVAPAGVARHDNKMADLAFLEPGLFFFDCLAEDRRHRQFALLEVILGPGLEW